MANFKKNQAVSVAGTKTKPERRAGKYIATHPTSKGDFIEVQLDGAETSAKFRASQVQAA